MIVKLPEIPDFTRPFALLMGSPGEWELKVARELEPYYGSIVMAANTDPIPLVLHTLRESLADAALVVFWAGPTACGLGASGACWQWFDLGMLVTRDAGWRTHQGRPVCGALPGTATLLSRAFNTVACITRLEEQGIHVWGNLDDLISAAKAARGGAR
jgi:hypothetical protein